MVLVISNNANPALNVYSVTLEEFGQREYHPFISTTKWDAVHIDVTDETPRGIIRQLVPLYKVVPHFDESNITPRMMQIFCEIYPDSAAEIKSTFIKDRDGVVNVIKRIRG